MGDALPLLVAVAGRAWSAEPLQCDLAKDCPSVVTDVRFPQPKALNSCPFAGAVDKDLSDGATECNSQQATLGAYGSLAGCAQGPCAGVPLVD